MGDIKMDPQEGSALADKLGTAAHDVSLGRDKLIDFNPSAGFADADPSWQAFVQTWITGLDRIGQFTGYLADYTQQLANHFGALDRTLVATAPPLRREEDLPPTVDHTPPGEYS